MQKKSVFIILSFLFIFSMPFSRSTPNRYHNGIPIQSLKRECSIPNQIILKVIQEYSGKKLIPRLLLHQYGFDIKAVRRHHITDYFIVETFNDCDTENLIKNLKADPLISDVSLNYIASITVDRPNDTFFQFQYALYNYGQVYYPTQNKMGNRGSDIKALDGWDWSIGNEDVVIAILDTGVAVDHEDLINKMVPGYNFIDDSVDAYDDNGHGTFVASIAAADTNNSTGVAGVSWNCKIMPVKVFDSQGLGDYLTIASGIRFAADREVKILNLSFGGESDSFILRDACRYAYDRGCVLV
ncbi:MAG: S8 family serine peptidase, partial [Candidatus Aminicenantes bacterium]|nr:S8 family serine peptidase [Candidatus Aminicenantes bacterium]